VLRRPAQIAATAETRDQQRCAPSHDLRASADAIRPVRPVRARHWTPMTLVPHDELDLIQELNGALEQDGGLGDQVRSLVKAHEQHEAMVGAVGLLAHPAAALTMAEHLDAAHEWLSAMVLHWVSARAAAERSDPLNGLSPWCMPWTPGRNSIWRHLFDDSHGGAPGMFSTDRAAFVDPHEAGDSAVDHHPLADLLGRWVTVQASLDAVQFAAQREDIRRVATELVRNVAEHAVRPHGRPDTCLALATIADAHLTFSVADAGPGIAATARPKLIESAGADDVDLTWTLFTRKAQLIGAARNRGLPQLMEIVGHWPAAKVRVTSGGADLSLTATGASAAPVVPALLGTVVTFVAPV
jgi:signal transduction histidine kinase